MNMLMELQNARFQNIIPPAAIVDNGTYTCAAIDTEGHGEVCIIASLGATDIAMTELRLTSSETSGGSYTEVAAGAFDTFPSATDDNKMIVWYVHKRNGSHKRFLKIEATAGNGDAGTYLSAIAIKGSPVSGPNSATERGLWGEKIL
jgi:hypothetical protein